MNKWVRVGMVLSGLWSLLLLGAIHRDAAAVGVTYYLGVLLASLLVGWLLGFMVFCTVKYINQERKEERDGRMLRDTDFEK